MDSIRTLRLAHQLLSRQAVYGDVDIKESLVSENRFRALDKYKGRPDVFGSFTMLPRLVIDSQPLEEYSTPVGIYSYPIDYILVNASKDAFGVPFAGHSPYLHIFSVPELDRTLKFSLNDASKINEFRAESSDVSESEEYSEAKNLVSRINDYVNSTMDEILKMFEGGFAAYKYRDQKWGEWFANLRKATGFKHDSDNDISNIIMYQGKINSHDINKLAQKEKFPLEEVLALIQNITVYPERAKTIMFPYEDRIRRLPEVQAMGMETYARFKGTKVLAERQRVVCDQAFVWNCTKHLSRSNQAKWTGLMRSMGFIGAVDDGTGTIHPNEPIQAVFFDLPSIKHLDVIENTSLTKKVHE